MTAFAAWVEARRDAMKWSRAKLAMELGISEMSVYRIERQGQQPEPELLARIISVLQGSWSAVRDLLLNDAATDEDGRRAATEGLPPIDPDIEARIARLNPQQKELMRDLLRQLLHEPE